MLPPGQIWDDELDNSATATAAGLPQSPGELDNEPASTKLLHPGGGAAPVPMLDLSPERLGQGVEEGVALSDTAASHKSMFAFSPGTGDQQVRNLAMSPVAPGRAGFRGSTAPTGGRRLAGGSGGGGSSGGGAFRRRRVPSKATTGVKAGLQQGLPGIDGGSAIGEGGAARPRYVDTSELLEPESAAESVDAAEAVGWPIVLTVPVAVLLNFLAVDWELYFDWLAERGLRHPVVALDIPEIGRGGEGGAGGGTPRSAHSHMASHTSVAPSAGVGGSAEAASQVGFSLGAVDAIVHEQARAEAAQDDAAKRHALASAMDRMRAERASVRSESARSAGQRDGGASAEIREGTVAMSDSTDSLGSDGATGFAPSI